MTNLSGESAARLYGSVRVRAALLLLCTYHACALCLTLPAPGRRRDGWAACFQKAEGGQSHLPSARRARGAQLKREMRLKFWGNKLAPHVVSESVRGAQVA